MIKDRVGTFDQYIESVKIRNKETHEDGHLVVFDFDEKTIFENRDYFFQCWMSHMSPYKALTFFWDYLNEL
jgi:hypothetical protein